MSSKREEKKVSQKTYSSLSEETRKKAFTPITSRPGTRWGIVPPKRIKDKERGKDTGNNKEKEQTPSSRPTGGEGVRKKWTIRGAQLGK